MKILCLKDQRIDDSDLRAVYNDVFQYYRDNADIQPELLIEERNFENLPFEVYYGQDNWGIQKSYIEKQAKQVKKMYGYEVDLVDFMVHEQNWMPMKYGIWGWNIAQPKYGYEVEQTRWDTRNRVNSIGTLYHEIMHSHDSFIYRLTDILIEEILGIRDWDNEVVHGKGGSYEYINHDENQEALRMIKRPLKQAFAKRRSLEKEEKEKLFRTRNLLQRLVELYKTFIILQTKEDKPITSNHIESWRTSNK